MLKRDLSGPTSSGGIELFSARVCTGWVVVVDIYPLELLTRVRVRVSSSGTEFVSACVCAGLGG